MIKSFRYASLALALVMAVMGSTVPTYAYQDLRLRARANKQINGFETELRGDYRERNSVPNRLNSQLEKINIPVGTPVAFCLVKGGVKSLIGVARVATIAGRPVASLELEANDGDTVPDVSAGDRLEAHQRTAAPFNPTPNCNSVLLIAAPFQN